MKQFLQKETLAYFERRASSLYREKLCVSDAVNSAVDSSAQWSVSGSQGVAELEKSKESLIEAISRSYREEYRDFYVNNVPGGFDDEEEFSLLYHNLMHGGGRQLDVLRTEIGFSLKMRADCLEMETEFAALIDKQNRELEASGDFNEHVLNTLASVHVEERQAFERSWRSRRQRLRGLQRTAMLHWMINAAAQQITKPDGSLWIDPVDAVPSEDPSICLKETNGPPASESFTIHLGSQLKVMHNLRLTSTELLTQLGRQSAEEDLQTAMYLYSSNLRGCVLIVDNRVSSYKGIKHDFAELCKSKAELHFPDIDAQLAEVRAEFRKSTGHLRTSVLSNDKLFTSLNSLEAVSLNNREVGACKGHGTFVRAEQKSSEVGCDDMEDAPTLAVGDVYITRHSTLTGAHVVFHLVAGSDEEELSMKELTSRHQVLHAARSA